MALRLFQRERGFGIADIELMDLAATPHVASLGRIEQPCSKPEHTSRHGSAFFLVAVKQRIGCAGGNPR